MMKFRLYLNFLISIEYLNSRAIPFELCALNCQTEFCFLFLILEGYYFLPLFIYMGMWQRPAECLRLPRVSVER